MSYRRPRLKVSLTRGRILNEDIVKYWPGSASSRGAPCRGMMNEDLAEAIMHGGLASSIVGSTLYDKMQVLSVYESVC